MSARQACLAAGECRPRPDAEDPHDPCRLASDLRRTARRCRVQGGGRGHRQEARGPPMQAAGLVGASRRRSVTTTRRDPAHSPAHDLVRRNFFAGKANELWVADITFVPTLAGFLFLAVVLDVWSRRIVRWAFSADLKTRVALAVHKPESVIHHSDQGSQGGFNRSLQHQHLTAERGTDRAPRSVFSIQAFCEAAC